jgi:uncharacterized membrane protein YdjX (TVP38/TMEM64 family)
MTSRAVRKAIAIAGFPLLIAALFVPVIIWHDPLWRLFGSTQRLREWVTAWGAWAPLVFVAIQSIQVVVFVIPGEIPQIAGGYLFGPWRGSLLSVAGILAGSTASFFLARTLGRSFVAALFPKEQVERVEKLLVSRSARIVFFLLFLIPGIPKDILCYAAGITPLRFPFFAAASMLGRLPGIVGSSLIGGAAASGRWVLLGVLSALALILFAAGLILRPRIQTWLEGLSERKRKTKNGAGKEGPSSGP